MDLKEIQNLLKLYAEFCVPVGTGVFRGRQSF